MMYSRLPVLQLVCITQIVKQALTLGNESLSLMDIVSAPKFEIECIIFRQSFAFRLKLFITFKEKNLIQIKEGRKQPSLRQTLS